MKSCWGEIQHKHNIVYRMDSVSQQPDTIVLEQPRIETTKKGVMEDCVYRGDTITSPAQIG